MPPHRQIFSPNMPKPVADYVELFDGPPQGPGGAGGGGAGSGPGDAVDQDLPGSASHAPERAGREIGCGCCGGGRGIGCYRMRRRPSAAGASCSRPCSGLPRSLGNLYKAIERHINFRLISDSLSKNEI